jgi:hypothetical protein
MASPTTIKQGAAVLKRTKTLVAACTGATALALLGAVPASAAQAAPAHVKTWDDAARGVVVGRPGVLVRADASTRAPVVDGVRFAEIVRISCKKYGQDVWGNSIWFRLDDDWSWNRSGRWVAARYVKNVDYVPFC